MTIYTRVCSLDNSNDFESSGYVGFYENVGVECLYTRLDLRRLIRFYC